MTRATFDPSGDLLTLMTDLTMLALVGIIDPPRPEAKVAIAKAKTAGIRVRMITGDHAVTAAAIARELGIDGRAITGAEFAAMSDDELQQQIDEIGVIARVTPEDKVRLVDILKRKGNVVAMTGDGVNDAPALKAADIGVAMGITGTDVSKEAAVMVLTDDNFATIIRAIEIGRKLYDNLMKYIRLQMASLFGFIVLFLVAAIFNILAGSPDLGPGGAVGELHRHRVHGDRARHRGGIVRYHEPTAAQGRREDHSAWPDGVLVVAGIAMAVSTLVTAQYALIAGRGNIVAQTIALTTFSFA